MSTTRALRKTRKKCIQKIKKDFEIELEQNIKVNPKSFYVYARNRSRTKDDKGNLLIDDSDMCKQLNRLFLVLFLHKRI